jgi:hypothetical protein
VNDHPEHVDIRPLYPATIDLFSDQMRVQEHLVRHVLTTPEAHGWQLLLPALDEALSTGTRLETLRAFPWSAPPGPVRWVLRGYMCSLDQTTRDCIRLDWWWEEAGGGGRCWKGFGPQGILVVFDIEVLRTGFLPGDPPTGCPRTALGRFALFLACLRSIRRKYNRAIRDARVQGEGQRLSKWLGTDPDFATWQMALEGRSNP